MSNPFVTGPAVILSGRWLAVVHHAAHIATVARRRNGLPESADYTTIQAAITEAMSQAGHNVTRALPAPAPSEGPDELTVEEAARMLGKSRRQVQRIANRLGGRLIGGRWLLDRRAVEEHIEGTKRG